MGITFNERSTGVVIAAFTDDAGTAVVPSSITWTLTDTFGTVVNSRSAVSVLTPAASVDIVLSGADLALPSNLHTTRVLTIEAVYTSSAGTDLPLKEEATITIVDLLNVP
jgi:hypothetical protein